MKYLLVCLTFVLVSCSGEKETTTKEDTVKVLTGKEVIAKSIAFHDPDGEWSAFERKLNIISSEPGKPDEEHYIEISIPKLFFNFEEEKGDSILVSLGIDKERPFTRVHDDVITDSVLLKHYGISEASHMFWKNFFEYLYGLPMKLDDPAIIVSENVDTVIHKEKSYLHVMIHHDPTLGKEEWDIYFDPKTFELKAFDFYFDHTHEKGEWVELEGEVQISNMKIPKVRRWFTLPDGRFISEDRLVSTEPLGPPMGH